MPQSGDWPDAADEAYCGSWSSLSWERASVEAAEAVEAIVGAAWSPCTERGRGGRLEGVRGQGGGAWRGATDLTSTLV
jgi:hypothetical protein